MVREKFFDSQALTVLNVLMVLLFPRHSITQGYHVFRQLLLILFYLASEFQAKNQIRLLMKIISLQIRVTEYKAQILDDLCFQQ